jgi:hypothetical protein
MAKMRLALAVVAPLCLAFAGPAAFADSFRCCTYLSREGMPSAEIAEKCGEPNTSESVREPIMARRANGSAFQIGVTTIETWTYDRGPGLFKARATIEEGIATKIELLGRN